MRSDFAMCPVVWLGVVVGGGSGGSWARGPNASHSCEVLETEATNAGVEVMMKECM